MTQPPVTPAETKRPAPKKKPQRRGFLSVLFGFIRGIATKLAIIIALVFLALEALTPSLDYTKAEPLAPSTTNYKKEGQEVVGTTLYRTLSVSLITADFDKVDTKFFMPTNGGTTDLPLIVIAADMLSTEELQQHIRAIGSAVLVIYSSDKTGLMTGPNWPFWPEGVDRNILAKALDVIETNPLTRRVTTQRRLHQAPEEIAEIVRWSSANLFTSRENIHLIGIGVGTLTATAAANRLGSLNSQVKTLSLVYPIADLSGMMAASMTNVPTLIQTPLGYVGSFLFRRLELKTQLPKVQAPKLLIIPGRDLRLPQWASEQAALFAEEPKKVMIIETDYKGLGNVEVSEKVQQAIRNWLMADRP